MDFAHINLFLIARLSKLSWVWPGPMTSLPVLLRGGCQITKAAMFHWNCSAATINTISPVLVNYFTYIAFVPPFWPHLFWGYIWWCGASAVVLCGDFEMCVVW